jgi:hypothetical protein
LKLTNKKSKKEARGRLYRRSALSFSELKSL